MQQVSSAEQYRELKKAAERCLGMVVHFSAGWCEPCKAVNELLSANASEYKDKVIFAEVDCEAHGDICESEGIESVPFVTFFRTPVAGENKAVERVADVVGAKLDQITMNVVSLYGENGGVGCQREDFKTLDEYLIYLTKRPGIVLFITGTPSRPRCGFTGRLCEMMHEMNAPFVFYDVMTSDEVCEALKKFSNWPTYPQVYVDGQLIGGLDVCKQLSEEGELKEALKI